MKTENYLVQNRNFTDINPLLCGQQLCRPSHSFGPAAREYYLLHYVVSGKGVFSADSRTYKVEAGSCFIIRPNEFTYYEADREQPWQYIWIGFECRIPLPSAFQKRVISSRRLASVFSRFQELGTMENGREAFLCARIWEIFSALDSPHETSGDRMKTYIDQAISCIEHEYMMPLSVEEIAGRLNLNRSYFSTLFKQYTGVSPQVYLLNFRLNKAARLLTEQGYSVTQAALSTGYSDVFTFSKMFKKKFACPPSQYQKEMLRQH